MRIVSLTVCGIAALVLFAGGTKTADSFDIPVPVKFSKSAIPKAKKVSCNKWEIVKGIRFYRAAMWSYQWQQGTSYERVTKWKPKHSCNFLKYLAAQARKGARQSRRLFYRWFKATYAKWECIHGHEGAWNSATGNGFYGGLQMDLGFQSSHGSQWMKLWGTADNWPVWAQLRAAEDAYHSGRGFQPWPNTARYCGQL